MVSAIFSKCLPVMKIYAGAVRAANVSIIPVTIEQSRKKFVLCKLTVGSRSELTCFRSEHLAFTSFQLGHVHSH